MKRVFLTISTCILLSVLLTAGARAADSTLRVGLRYGSNALFSANLENVQGSGEGYRFGWFDEDGLFTQTGYTPETEISMTAGGPFYVAGDGSYSPVPPSGSAQTVGAFSLELSQEFATFEEAAYAAAQLDGGFPAWVDGRCRVRLGCWSSGAEAEAKAALYVGTTWRDMSDTVYDFSASTVTATSTTVTVTITRTARVLFQFDGQGRTHLGVLPDSAGAAEAVTWFRGNRYRGGFEYRRGGNLLTVVNVVDLEDYVKGVVPYEMSSSWPLEALKAQAVCARTYALRATKHHSAGFDVCDTTDCQVYKGLGSASTLTDQAVEETAGICVWYQGKLADAVYCSSNGGASESGVNIWGGEAGYLIGKEDPYEALTSIPNYSYSVRYTAAELTAVLQGKGYQIGTVADARVTRFSPTGNVLEVTVTDTAGRTVTVSGGTCRTVFNTTGKNVRSSRYTINGGDLVPYPVNGTGETLSSIGGSYVISGDGRVSFYSGGETYVVTADGVRRLEQSTGNSRGVFTISGTGFGHNVGMSQYGAKAMAEQGLMYTDILHFYYTDIVLE